MQALSQKKPFLHSVIHSFLLFISDICIAPLQVHYYSEAQSNGDPE